MSSHCARHKAFFMKAKIEKKDIKESTVIELIYECGVLGMTIDDIVYFLSQRIDKKQLKQDLENPLSDEHEALCRGRAEGKFKLLSSLHQAAELAYDGSFKALSEQRKSDAIAKKIKENFEL